MTEGAGAVELQPGDKVLIKLDAFRGQRQKLKNRWSGRRHTHICCEVWEDWEETGAPLDMAVTLASQIQWRAFTSKLHIDRFKSTWNRSEDPTFQRWKGIHSVVLFGLWAEHDPTSVYARIFRPEEALTKMPRNGTGYRIPEVGKQAWHVRKVQPDRGDNPVRWETPETRWPHLISWGEMYRVS